MILLAVVLFLIIFSFGRINAPRNEEQIDFFISAYASFANDFEGEVLTGQHKDDYDANLYGKPILTGVKLNFQSPLVSEFSTAFSVNGLLGSDILIADKSWMLNGDGTFSASSFLELSDEVLAAIGIKQSDYEFLTVDASGTLTQSGGKRYAIKVADLPKIKNFAVFNIDGEEEDIDAYLFIFAGKANVNQGGNRQTLYCMKKFFERYGV